MKIKNKGFQTNKIVRRIFAGMLSFCMMVNLCGSIHVYADEVDEDIEFTIKIQADEGSVYNGDFMVRDGILYVDAWAVADMAPDISNLSYYLSSDRYAASIDRGEINIDFTKEEVIGEYIPFAKTMTFLGLAPTYSESENILYITEAMNLDDLESTMLSIYNSKEYNMAYWQNTKDMGGYDAHLKWAAVADCIKNWEYISYMTGAEEKALYERAFWDLLKQEEDMDDETSFLNATAQTGKTIADNYGLIKDFAKFSYKGPEKLYSDQLDAFLGTFDKATDYMQLEELVDLVAFSSVVGNQEDSCSRGLDLIVNSAYVSRTNEKMASIGKEVLSTYRQEEPLWKQALQEVQYGAAKDFEKEFYKKAVYGKVLADITNKSMDAIFGTQKQVDATLQAAAFLDVQRLAGRYYYEMRNLAKIAFNENNWQDYAGYLKNARDAMVVYLQCGAEAYRAIAIDSELNIMTKNVVMHVNDELITLSMYQDGDFNVAESVYDANELLVSLARELQEKTEQASELNMLSILLTWDPNAEDMLDGKFTLDYYISGTDSDGNDFIWQLDQSEYYKADGSLAGKKTYAEGQVLLELYDMQSNYYLSVGPVEFPTNAWIESVEVSLLDANQNKQPLGDKYLYRGQTGFWGYDFEIHQGVIQ